MRPNPETDSGLAIVRQWMSQALGSQMCAGIEVIEPVMVSVLDLGVTGGVRVSFPASWLVYRHQLVISAAHCAEQGARLPTCGRPTAVEVERQNALPQYMIAVPEWDSKAGQLILRLQEEPIARVVQS